MFAYNSKTSNKPILRIAFWKGFFQTVIRNRSVQTFTDILTGEPATRKHKHTAFVTRKEPK